MLVIISFDQVANQGRKTIEWVLLIVPEDLQQLIQPTDQKIILLLRFWLIQQRRHMVPMLCCALDKYAHWLTSSSGICRISNDPTHALYRAVAQNNSQMQ